MKDPTHGIELAKIMLEQMKKENELEKRLIQISSYQNMHWNKYDSRMCIFPSLTEEDVRNICCGNYQIKQSKSYIDEHLEPSYLDEDDLGFVVELCDKQTDLLRARFHSCHSNTKHHIATVQHDDNQEQPLQGWFCTCASGSRTVGCCVHVTAVLWYMEVKQGEIDTNLHPLSAARLLGFVDDSNMLVSLSGARSTQPNYTARLATSLARRK